MMRHVLPVTVQTLYTNGSTALIFEISIGKGKVTPKQAYVALRGPGG
jgi:hypothetical protein